MDLILKYINSIDAPAAIGPYSQAIALNGFLFMSGQLGLDPQYHGIARRHRSTNKSNITKYKSDIA